MIARETKRAENALAGATEAGMLEGYASLFGVADSGGDIVMKGAFARSLARRGAKGVKMLWQHNGAEPIGLWSEIVEDAKGLKVIGRLDLSVARAREAFSLLRDGAVDGLSIGFKTRHATTYRVSGLRRLHEVDLWEISIVTFPMLDRARVDAVKRRPLTPDAHSRLLRRKAQEAASRFQSALRDLRV